MMLRFILALLMLFSLSSCNSLLDPDELKAYQIHHAQFTSSPVENPSLLPPLSNAQAWHPVSIPHNWDKFDYATGRDGWYDIDYRFDADDYQVMHAIYMPRLNMNTAIYVNNKRLNAGGDFIEPISRNWNRPLIFVIPEGMLHPGHNRITVYVNAYLKSGGGLGRLYIGPNPVLDRSYRRHYRAFISTTQISCSLTFALSFAMFLFWYLRKEKMFFWFAWASLLSAFYLMNHFVQNIPVSRHLWEWAFQISIDGFAFCMMLFTHRWLKLERFAFEKLLWFYLFTSAWVLYALPDEFLMTGVNINHGFFLLLGAYVSWLLFQAWYQQKNHWLLMPLGALVIDFIVAFHDWQQLVFSTSNNDHYWMPLGELVILLAVGSLLIRYFVQLHERAEQFSIELQNKVVETTAQLEQRHAELKKLEDKRLIEHERERILHELHDGIGGQLIAAISLSESKSNNKAALKQTLQDALLDLRLVIDSLDEETRDLCSLLGMLRMRLASQMNAQDVALVWHIDPQVNTEDLGYEITLNVLRIVQEAINNSVRHAAARTIRFSLTSCKESHGIYIEISDDGQGIQQAPAGRGMGHMQLRAQRIGAELKVASSSQGTTITICLPQKA